MKLNVMAYLTLLLLASTSLLYQVNCYRMFRDNIPNGGKVPNPCDPKKGWQGVGHEASVGGGKKNPFGQDFESQNFIWSEALCKMDSDGDGMSNGAELGDPDCTWVKNVEYPNTPERSSNISHPGICEPIGSEKCQNSFLKACSDLEFKCDAITNDDEIFSVDLRLTEEKVPANETTYMCQAIDLERAGVNMDIDYHLVATTAYIDTVEVLHHVLVFGCDDSATIPNEYWSPRACYMNTIEKCKNLIGVWSLGNKGICYHKDAGIRIGNTGMKKVVIELHWNNEEKIDTFTDSSGLTIFLTPNLRENDAGMFKIGQTDLTIPPRTVKHTEIGTCSAECTNHLMTGDIKIVGAANHMHTLGSAATSRMISDEGDTTIILHEETYDFNSPKFVVFKEPLVMRQGYSLEMKCNYDSTSRDEVTYHGLATSDEMCLGFFMYYPTKNWKRGKDCVAYGEYIGCYESSVCDFAALANETHPETMMRDKLLKAYCEPGICREKCMDVVREIMKEPCFHGQNYRLIKNFMNDNNQDPSVRRRAMELAYSIDSCNRELALEECRNAWTASPPVGGATSTKIASYALICIFTILMTLI